MNLVEELRKVASPSNHGCFMCDAAYNFGVDDSGGCNTCMNTMSKIADLIERYYIPKPLFKDGEPVNLGRAFVNSEGETDIVSCISFYNFGYELCGIYDDNTNYKYDERVERPMPNVFDANGVVIKVGDMVWFDNSPNDTKFRVQEVTDRVRIIVADDSTGVGQFVDGAKLTHIQPMLDADRIPIKIGDTMYQVETGNSVVVTDVCPEFNHFIAYIGANKYSLYPRFYTHCAPDTQENIDADIIKQWRDGVCPQKPPFTRDNCIEICTCNSCLAKRIMETCDRQRKLDGRQ